MAPRVRIYSAHCSRWDFLYYQFNSLKNFCKDDWELIIINDARADRNITNFFDDTTRADISSVCKELDISCIEFPEALHTNRTILFPNVFFPTGNNPNSRCSDVCQYALVHSIKDNFDGLCVLMDSDMFLVKPTSFVEYMGENEIFFVPQERPNVDEYPWNGFVGWWPLRTQGIQELNFDYGTVNGTPTDCGGFSWSYLKKYPDLKKRHVQEPRIDIREIGTYKDITGFLPTVQSSRLQQKIAKLQDVPVFSETAAGGLKWQFMEDFIVHYGQGGNWEKKSEVFHLSKTRTLLEYFGDRWLSPHS